jgi:hypothetical protein
MHPRGVGRAEQAARVAGSPGWDEEALAELERCTGPRCDECGDPLQPLDGPVHDYCGAWQVPLPLEA